MTKFEKIEAAVTRKVEESGHTKKAVYDILSEVEAKLNCFIYADFPTDDTREYKGCIHFKVFGKRVGRITGCIGTFNIRLSNV